jgi:hypothetical protein
MPKQISYPAQAGFVSVDSGLQPAELNKPNLTLALKLIGHLDW